MRKNSFIKFIQLWGIIFLIGIAVSIVAIDIIGSYRDFNSRADQMRTDYISRQKQIIKKEVKRVADLISYEKSQSDILIKKKIKSRVYEAYAIARNIYQQNKNAKSKSEIQKMITDALRPIRFEDKNGYYFATRLDGVEILFADKPEMEGLNLLNVQDIRDRYVIKDMIKMVTKSGEGYYEYLWTKPNFKGNNFKKISFVKLFEPYDWVIGTGLYVDDFEAKIKAALLSTVSKIRFGKEGYIFINRFNGDALVSNGKLVSGTKKLWEVFNKNPAKTKDLFEKELNAAQKPEGDFIYYSLIKLTNPDKQSPKASFIYGIHDLQWLVGAGVYLDDVETNIALMQTELNNQIKAKMFYFILIVMGIVLLFLLFFNSLNRGLKNDFNLFISFFNRAVHSDKEIDRTEIKFIELDQMAEYANMMLTNRKQTEQALRDSEQEYKTLLENLPGSVYRGYKDWSVEFFDNKIEIIAGYSIDEFNSGKIKWIDIIVKEDIDTAKLSFIKALKTNKLYVRSYRIKSKVGGIHWIQERGQIVCNNQGEIEYVNGVFFDITDRKRLEEALRKSEEKLARSKKMESLGLLAGGVAHDLNNVLSGIVSYPELLLLDLPEDSRLRKPIETMRESGHKAAAIVQDLLTVARGVATTKEPLNLNDLIGDYLNSPEFKKLEQFYPAIAVKTSLDSDLFNISCSRIHIQKMVMNLVSNASEAIEGIGNVTISTMNRYIDRPLRGYDDVNTGEYVVLAVSDDGSGISPDDIERIFEPFYTKKEMGRSGTGLGLAVVWNVLQDHKGYIDVTSDENGTTFELFFPITRKEISGKDLSIPINDYKGNKETILVVDDVKSQREIASEMLRTLGYKAHAVSSGEKAVKYLKEHTVDLILLDMIMDPGINGRQTYEQIIKIHPDQKAVIASGFAETDDVKKAQKLGAGQYIKKPLTLEKLGVAVRDELNK